MSRRLRGPSSPGDRDEPPPKATEAAPAIAAEPPPGE